MSRNQLNIRVSDELEAFRDAVRDVRPLAAEPRVSERRKPRPRGA